MIESHEEFAMHIKTQSLGWIVIALLVAISYGEFRRANKQEALLEQLSGTLSQLESEILSNSDQRQSMQTQLQRLREEHLNQLSTSDTPVVLDSSADLAAADSENERLSNRLITLNRQNFDLNVALEDYRLRESRSNQNIPLTSDELRQRITDLQTELAQTRKLERLSDLSDDNLDLFLDTLAEELALQEDAGIENDNRANQLLALDSARQRLSSLMEPDQIEIVDDFISRENRSIATTFSVRGESVNIELIERVSNVDLQFETVKKATLRLVEGEERLNEKGTTVQRARNIQQLRTLLPKVI